MIREVDTLVISPPNSISKGQRLLHADFFGISFCSLQLEHHKHKLLFRRDGKIVRGAYKICLFHKAISAGGPDNYSINVFGALNGNALPIGQYAERFGLGLLNDR